MAAQSDHTLQPHASQITRNVDGADDFVVVDFISREQQAPAITPGQYNFRRPVNPSTRVAQFQHLQNLQKYYATKDLPLWAKAQEMSPLFKPLDVMLVYLRFEEKFTLSKATNHTARDQMPFVLTSTGFDCPPIHVLQEKCNRLRDSIQSVMEALRLDHVRQPLPPSGLAETTISVPGPVTRSYTVFNQPIPQALIDAAHKTKEQCNLCVQANMDLFFDVQFRSRIAANTWYRFRVVDTSLLPWDPTTEKMSDVNPQILHKDHYFQQNCIPPFWQRSFEAGSLNGASGDAALTGYCFEHDRIEKYSTTKTQLVMQLAGNYFSHEDWVVVLSRMRDPVLDAKGSKLAVSRF
jgi:hypothetical protein